MLRSYVCCRRFLRGFLWVIVSFCRSKPKVEQVSGKQCSQQRKTHFSLPAVSASTVSSPNGHSFLEFLKLGVEHIVTGYDHLLFLFGLMVVCRNLRSILTVITCFTIAHSITLALATLDIVRLPGSIVEPLIAASIAYVGIENLVR